MKKEINPTSTNYSRSITYKQIPRKAQFLTSNDLNIIEEIFESAGISDLERRKVGKGQKMNLYSVLKSYEIVLERHGIRASEDSTIYRTVVKMSMKGKNVGDSLAFERNRVKKGKMANAHYEHTLMGKCYVGWLTWLIKLRRYTTRIGISRVKSTEIMSREHPNTNNKENEESLSNFSKQNSSSFSQEASELLLSSNYSLSQSKPGSGEFLSFQSPRGGSSIQDVDMTFAPRSKLTTNLGSPLRLHEVYHAGEVNTMKNTMKNTLNTINPMKTKQWELSTAPDSSLHTMDSTQYKQKELSQGVTYADNSYTSTSYSTSKAPQYIISISDQIPSQESLHTANSHLKLKYLRRWLLFIAQRKNHLKRKEVAIENWLVAMHFYNQTLATKGFLCLLHNTNNNYTVQQTAKEVTRASHHGLENKYFLLWAHYTEQKRDLLERMTMYEEEWNRRRKEGILKIWHGVYNQRRYILEDYVGKLIQRPYSIYLLLLIIRPAHTSTLITYESQFEDLCQHYTYIPHRGYLTSTCLTSLKDFAKSSIFTTWKIYTHRLSHLRKSSVFGMMKKSFTALENKAQRKISRRTKLSACLQNKMEGIKESVFGGLRRYSTRKSSLRSSQSTIIYNKSSTLLHKCLNGWLSLILTKTERHLQKSEVDQYTNKLLLVRVFNLWRSHMQDRQINKSKHKLSLIKHYANIQQKAFRGWKFMAVYNREITTKILLVRELIKNKRKSYFYAQWKLNFRQSLTARLHHQTSLLNRAFSMLYESSEFRKIKRSMLYNMKMKRIFTLIAHTFVPWRAFAQKQSQRRFIKRTIIRRRDNLLKKSIFDNFWDYSRIKIFSKLSEQKGVLHYLQRMVIKSFLLWRSHSQRKTEFTGKTLSITYKGNIISKSKIFTALRHFTQKQIKLKRGFEVVGCNRLEKLIENSFKKWHLAYMKNEKKVEKFQNRKDYKIEKQSFGVWRKKVRKLTHFRAKFTLFVSNSCNRYTSQTFSFWRDFYLQRKYKSQRWKLATYFFLERKLRHVLQGLQRNKNLSKNVRILNSRTRESFLRESLLHWKLSFLYLLVSKRIRYRRAYYLLSQSLGNLRKYAEERKRKRKIGQTIAHNTYINSMNKYFKSWCLVSANKLKSRIITEHYYEGYVYKLVKGVFSQWKLWSYKRRERKRIIDLFGKCRGLGHAHQFVQVLRDKVEQSRARGRIIAPFARRKNRKFIRKLIHNWFGYAEKKHILRNNLEVFISNRATMLKSRVFYSIAESVARKADRERKLKFQICRKQKRRIRYIFKGLLNHTMGRCMNRDAYIILNRKRANKMKQMFLWRWIDSFNNHRDMIDTLTVSEEFFKIIAGRSFFRNLRKFALNSKFTKEQNCKGRTYYSKRLKLSTLEAWKIYFREKKISNVQNILASNHYAEKLEKEYFQNWILFTFNKLKWLHETKSAIHFYVMNLKAGSFSCWRYHSQNAKREKMIIANFQLRHEILLGKKFIKLWRESINHKMCLTLAKVAEQNEEEGTPFSFKY